MKDIKDALAQSMAGRFNISIQDANKVSAMLIKLKHGHVLSLYPKEDIFNSKTQVCNITQVKKVGTFIENINYNVTIEEIDLLAGDSHPKLLYNEIADVDKVISIILESRTNKTFSLVLEFNWEGITAGE